MKKFSYLFIALFAAVMLIGCKGEKKAPRDPNANIIQPEFVVSKEDTTQVRRLTKQLLYCLEQKDLDGALAMLNTYSNGEIRPLSASASAYAKQQMVFGMFLGMKYEVDHLIFMRTDDSEVKFTVTMFERTDENDHRPNKASFLLRPIRHHGKWYLTLADTRTEKLKSKIQH